MSVVEEAATVYRAGKRRYLTKRAAFRGAANHYLREMFRYYVANTPYPMMFFRGSGGKFTGLGDGFNL